MRLIKLSKKEFPSLGEVNRFFEDPESALRKRGFLIPKGWISENGIEPGELLLFSYGAVVRYVARAASSRQDYEGPERTPEGKEYPHRFILKLDSLKAAALDVKKLERKLQENAGLHKRIAKGQGWPILPGDDAAVAMVEQLARESLPLVDDEGVEEGLKEDRTVAFRRRNETVIKQRRDKDGNACQVCGFCLAVEGRYIIDCHHLFSLKGGVRVTHVADLACLCPTCHRIAHARRQPFTLSEIRTLRATVAAAKPAAASAGLHRPIGVEQ